MTIASLRLLVCLSIEKYTRSQSTLDITYFLNVGHRHFRHRGVTFVLEAGWVC